MRRTKSLWISLITLLLVSIAALSIPLGACTPTTLLTAPTVKDQALTPGETFTISITIADVTNLWGYLIFLDYDTNVLTATNYYSSPIFPLQEPGEINDPEGYVTMAYHMPFGVPSGFTTVPPVPIAYIDFSVDALGWSWLDLHDTVLSNHVGGAIAHEEIDGLFANIPQQHAADLVRKSAWPQYHHWVESKHPEQTLFGKVRSLGNVPTTAYVNFTIKDGDGLWEEVFTTDSATIDPDVIVNLHITITSADLTGHGKYYVKAQCWYDDGTGTFVPGVKIKSFAFALVP